MYSRDAGGRNRTGFDRSQLMFEFTENEPMRDPGHIDRIIAAYRDFGFMTAVDDFGAGKPPEVG
jgi:EAL domain-containing protein (putative c-di-GMP-specific phosphodiesterase class I)